MSTRMIMAIVVLAGLNLGSAQTARADDQTAAAEAAAKADAATPEGEKYQESVGRAFGKEHGATVGECARSTRRPDLSDFVLLLRVAAAGVVQEVLVKPRTNLSGCVQARLTGWKLTPPPRAGFWVRIQVDLKRK